ncbi:MAG: hypothetical protein Q4D74_06105, partial [Comamonadaceae bacterium]|nr:hypothetical protein [Comamonadaceae bacterium]
MSALPAPLAHLLIANALPWPGQAAGDAAMPPARPRLPRAWARRLPHLAALLRHMRVHHHEALEDDSPDTALERALAQAHGLPGVPGAVPWAAFESGAAPQAPCAWLTPCHWQLGLDHVLLADPATLALSAQEADALHAAMAPLLAEDGITLHRRLPASHGAPPPDPPAAATLAAPGMRWLAQGEPLRHLHTCSVARAASGRVTPGRLAHPLPEAPAGQAARLARLQNEMQMLLHTHPVNTAREAAGLPPVNALWISGAGALPAPHPPAPGVRLETRLPAAPPAAPARP